MEITRSGILMDCLEGYNREMHKYSRHGAGLIALPGYEQLFDDLSQKCKMLRAMIMENMDREQKAKAEEFAREHREELQDPEVQRRLAQWQKDLMDGKKPDASWTEPKPGEKWTVDGEDWYWDAGNQVWVRNAAGVTPDELLRRRRKNRAEGFKPAPVVYPGGEDDGTVQG